MADINRLIRKSNNGYALPAVEDLCALKNEYEHELLRRFSDYTWLREQKNLLDQLFDCIGNYRASVVDEHVEKILWAFEVKKDMMCIDMFVHFSGKIDIYYIEWMKRSISVIHANARSLQEITFSMLTVNVYRKELPSVEVMQRIANNYNFILNQAKDALGQLGIVNSDIFKIFNMQRRGQLSEILGWSKYNNLAAYFQHLR